MSKRQKKKKSKLNYLKNNREDAIAQGFYDGRYRVKVIPDKKKKLKKEGEKNIVKWESGNPE